MPEESHSLSTLYLYLSGRCNLNCRHCWINPEFTGQEQKDGGINYPDLKKAIIEAREVGLSSVKLTGGEPFLYEHILDLMKWLKENALGIDIETNGTLIGEEEAQVMKDCGVSNIAVSLDGSTAEIHEAMRKVDGCFARAVNGIKKAVERGLNLQIIFSVWKKNEKDLENTVLLAKELGAKSFKINIVSYTSRGEKMKERGELLSLEEVLGLREPVRALSKKLKFSICLDIPLAFFPVSQIEENLSKCPIKNILGIIGDGSVSLCGIGTTVKELVMGNISRDSIAQIWHNSQILKSIREDIPGKLEGVCGKCIFKNYCLGKCRAQAYWDDKSFLAPLDFCQEAYGKGLFPRTRIYESNITKQPAEEKIDCPIR